MKQFKEMSQNIPRNDLAAFVACEILVSFCGAVRTCCSTMFGGPRGCGLSHRLGVGKPCSLSILHSREPGATAGASTEMWSLSPGSLTLCFLLLLPWLDCMDYVISRWWRHMEQEWQLESGPGFELDLWCSAWVRGLGMKHLCSSSGTNPQLSGSVCVSAKYGFAGIWVSEEPLISFSCKVNAEWKTNFNTKANQNTVHQTRLGLLC